MSDVLEALPDPKEVDSAEYAIVHAYVTELEAEGIGSAAIRGSLDELSRTARSVLVEYTRAYNSY